MPRPPSKAEQKSIPEMLKFWPSRKNNFKLSSATALKKLKNCSKTKCNSRRPFMNLNFRSKEKEASTANTKCKSGPSEKTKKKCIKQ